MTADDPSQSAQAPKTNGAATASLVLGLMGFALCFPVLSGIVAVGCGITARHQISRSEGAQRGKGLALAGIITGTLQILVGGALLVVGVMAANDAGSSSTLPPIAVAPRGTTGSGGAGGAGGSAGSPGVAPTPPKSAPGIGTLPPGRAADRSIDDGVLEARVGALVLVDIGPGVVPVEREFERQQKLAEKASQRLVLWTVVPGCKPCQGVSASLTDPRLQKALSNTRLVRVNVRDHQIELARLKIPTEKIPGFSILGVTQRPLDYINGGEWDADIPENIAPVLEKFVRGEYKQRRERWRGGRRDDETPI